MGKTKLIIAQALLFAIVIIFFGLVIVEKKFSLKENDEEKEEEEITAYYEEKYQDLDLETGTLNYDDTNESYYIRYTDKENSNHYFTITYKENNVTDDYENSYVKGKTVITKAKEELNAKYQEIFQNTNYEKIEVSFNDLDSYNEEDRKKILTGNYTNCYNISFYIEVPTLDEIYLTNLITSFINISKENNLVASNYSITFNNNGIIKMVKADEGGIIYE